MKVKYVINTESYVIVSNDKPNQFVGEHFKNGCARNLLSNKTSTLSEMETWINKLRVLYNE